MADDDLDPYDPTLPAAPAGVSTDASQPGALKKMWDNWTSRPENNAAMLNFGLQLLQPVAPGQTQLGHFASAIGAGAEASGRNVAAQEERQLAEQKAGLAEREETRKEAETAAYGELVRGKGGAGTKPELLQLQQRIKSQAAENKAFSTWLTGEGGKFVMEDNVWNAVKQKFPQIKTKTDLMQNPDALRYAKQLHHQTYAPEPADATVSGMTDADVQALQWAKANPKDPRAVQILQRLGGGQ